MIINNDVFKKFIENINVNGLLNSVVINFEENGLTVSQMTEDNICFVDAKLSKDVFRDYKSIGKIGFDRLDKFKKFLDLFGDSELIISKKENFLDIKSGSKEGSFVTTSLEYVKETEKKPVIEYVNVIKIDSVFLKDMNKSLDTLSEDFGNMTFDISDQKLIVESGEVNKIKQSLDLKEKCENSTSKYGVIISSFIKNLEGEVTVKLKTDSPISFEMKSNNSRITYVVSCSGEAE